MKLHKQNRQRGDTGVKTSRAKNTVNQKKYNVKSLTSVYLFIGIVSLVTILIFSANLITSSKNGILNKMSLTSEETVKLFEYQDSGINIAFSGDNDVFNDALVDRIENDLRVNVTPHYVDKDKNIGDILDSGVDLVLGRYYEDSKMSLGDNVEVTGFGGYVEAFYVFGDEFNLVTPFEAGDFETISFGKNIGINESVDNGAGIINNIHPTATIQYLDDEEASTMLKNGTLDLYISTAPSLDRMFSDYFYSTALSDRMYIRPTSLYYRSDSTEIGGIFEEYFSVDTSYSHIRTIKNTEYTNRAFSAYEGIFSDVTREFTVGIPHDNFQVNESLFMDQCNNVGLACNIISGSPDELLKKVETGEVDVVFPVSSHGANDHSRSPVIFSVDMIGVVHTDYSGNDISALVLNPKTSIGVVKGTFEEDYAKKSYVANEIITYSDSTQLLSAIDDHEIEVALTTLPRLATYYENRMFTSVVPITLTNISQQIDYTFVYNSEDPEVEAIFDVMFHVLTNTGFIKSVRNEVMLINSSQLLLDSKQFESKVLVTTIIGFIIFATASFFIVRSFKERSLVDPLTQLHNRHGLNRRQQNKFRIKKLKLNDYVLCFIDVNNFKSVNDVLGHNEGDALLKKIGTTLLRYKDIDSYRIGGDEFAIIYKKRERVNIEQIAATLQKKIEINGLAVGISMGIVDLQEFPEIADFDEALDFADYCMYIAKDNTVNHIIHANLESYTDFIEFAAVDTSFAEHMNRGRIIPVFQPTVDLQEDITVGFEVLGRKVSDNGDLISIYRYINKFRNSNSFAKLDVFMFEEACKFLRKMRDRGNTLHRISVNYDPRSFRLIHPSRLTEIVKKYNLETSDITLELTEGSLVNDITFDYVKSYKNCGFSLALDDFSAGHSSLQYITKMDFDYIKIDKALVDDVENGTSAKVEIFRSLLELFRSLGKTLVIEGVENANQIDLLEDLNVHYVQGYYYSKPLVENDAIEFFEKKNNS